MFSSGGNGGGGGGGGGGWGGGHGDSSGGFGLAAIWAAYLKLLETHPWPTKIATSAGLNAVGDFFSQTLFEKDKKFDWLRFAKFTFLVCRVAVITHDSTSAAVLSFHVHD